MTSVATIHDCRSVHNHNLTTGGWVEPERQLSCHAGMVKEPAHPGMVGFASGFFDVTLHNWTD